MKKGLTLLFGLVMVLSLAACSTKKEEAAKEVPITDILDAVKTAYGEAYVPTEEHDAVFIEEMYGLTQDMYDQVVAEGSAISMHVDTFIGVKAKEGKADEVEKVLNDYHDKLLNDSLQYPINQKKIKASKVYKKGNYVFFIQLGQIPMDVQNSEDEAATLKAFEEQNQIAVDAIDKMFE